MIFTMDLTYKLKRCTNPTQKNIILAVEVMRLQQTKVIKVKDLCKITNTNPKQIYRELSNLEKNHIILVYTNGRFKEVLI